MQEVSELSRNKKFTVLLLFRGIWCPACATWLKGFQAFNNEVESLDGQIVAAWGIKNYNGEEDNDVAKAWNLSYPVITDPEHSLRKFLSAQGIVDVAPSNPEQAKPIIEKIAARATPILYNDDQYFQPGIVAFRGDFADLTNTPDKVLHAWASVPSEGNYWGATQRTEPEQVLKEIKGKLAA